MFTDEFTPQHNIFLYLGHGAPFAQRVVLVRIFPKLGAIRSMSIQICH